MLYMRGTPSYVSVSYTNLTLSKKVLTQLRGHAAVPVSNAYPVQALLPDNDMA